MSLPSRRRTIASVVVIAWLTLTSTAAMAAGSFTATGSMHSARVAAGGVTLDSGKVLIVGGTDGSNRLTSAELYDPATGMFSTTGSLQVGRSSPLTIKLQNGKVLVAGGLIAGTTATASAELYDPATGTFTPTGSMNAARWNGAATLLSNGKVFVAGGQVITSGQTIGVLASAETYDPATGTFTTTTGAMSTPRNYMAAVTLANGKALIIGGHSGPVGVFLSSSELFDPATGTFSASGSMSSPREVANAVRLASGNVLVVGGQNNNGVLKSAEVYDTSTGAFSPTGDMSAPRDYPSIAVLASGAVLVAGGISTNYTTYLSSSETYDPGSGTFSAGPSMSVGRATDVTATLASGKVLIAGGSNSTVTLETAELFDPAGQVPDPSAPPGACPIAPTPPAGAVGASINGGATYTNSPKVTIDLVWPACTTEVSISNDGGFKTPQVFVPAAKVSWTLSSSGPERLPKTVYVRLGSSTQTYTDDIILDQTRPKISSVVAIPSGKRLQVKTKAVDKTSGVSKIQVTGNKAKPGVALVFKKSMSIKPPVKVIWVRVQDGAGNWSDWKKAT